MTILERVEIQTLTSLVVSTRLKAKHLLTYLSLITQKHLTFHKGEYVGRLEPAVIDDSTMEQNRNTSS